MLTEVEEPFRLAARPQDERPLDDWARQNIKVGSWSPWEGNFMPERTPWIIDPLRVLGRPGPRRVTILGPAAGSKSTIGETFLAWAIDNAPGFAAWYAQDEEAAKEFAETRVQRFLASCDAVAKWFPDNRHAKRTQAINFPHMSFVIQAANEGNAQSKHIRHLIADEPWMYKPGILTALHKRTTRFAHNRTILELSTGPFEGDETDEAYQQGTRQDWQIFCPKCGRLHVPLFSFGSSEIPGGVKWDRAAKRKDGTWDKRRVAETTVYECPLCATRHAPNAANAWAVNVRGGYTAPAEDAMPDHWSFHWNCIASDFAQLGTIAVEFLDSWAAVKRGTTHLLQEFVQKKEARAWSDKFAAPTIQIIGTGYKLGESWVDEAIRFLAVDCQQTHFWAVVRAFSSAGVSRQIACARLESWEAVRAFQLEHKVPDDCTVVDSGKFTDSVYQSCAKRGWIAVKGEPAVGGYLMRVNDQQVRVIARVSADEAGRPTQFYPSQLLPESRQGWCHLVLVSDEMSSEVLANARDGRVASWSIAADAPEFYRRQLASMVRLTRRNPKTNKVERYWREMDKVGNHLWDCERYILGAAFVAGFFYTQPQTMDTETQAQ